MAYLDNLDYLLKLGPLGIARRNRTARRWGSNRRRDRQRGSGDRGHRTIPESYQDTRPADSSAINASSLVTRLRPVPGARALPPARCLPARSRAIGRANR